MLQNETVTVGLLGIAATFAAAFAPKLASVYEMNKINESRPGTIARPEDVPAALHQKELRIRNLDCIGSSQRWFDAGQMSLSGVFCPDTGDILVQYRLSPTGKKYDLWIEDDDRRAGSNAIGLLLSSPAKAASIAFLSRGESRDVLIAGSGSQEFRSIYQVQASNIEVIRIVQKTSGECIRQSINSYSGQVVGRTIGPCSIGFCTLFPSVGPDKQIVNDRCVIGRPSSNRVDLTWSTGKVTNVTLSPPSVDGRPGRLIQPHATGGTVKTSRGTIGWCWKCKP